MIYLLNHKCLINHIVYFLPGLLPEQQPACPSAEAPSIISVAVRCGRGAAAGSPASRRHASQSHHRRPQRHESAQGAAGHDAHRLLAALHPAHAQAAAATRIWWVCALCPQRASGLIRASDQHAAARAGGPAAHGGGHLPGVHQHQ